MLFIIINIIRKNHVIWVFSEYFVLKHMEGLGSVKILFNLYPKFLV